MICMLVKGNDDDPPLPEPPIIIDPNPIGNPLKFPIQL